MFPIYKKAKAPVTGAFFMYIWNKKVNVSI